MEKDISEFLILIEGATEKVYTFLSTVSENEVTQVQISCHILNKTFFISLSKKVRHNEALSPTRWQYQSQV